jgi:hypothetical protein
MGSTKATRRTKELLMRKPIIYDLNEKKRTDHDINLMFLFLKKTELKRLLKQEVSAWPKFRLHG